MLFYLCKKAIGILEFQKTIYGEDYENKTQILSVVPSVNNVVDWVPAKSPCL